MINIIVCIFAGLVLLRSARGRVPHCPTCFRMGRVRYFGRYCCSACGSVFVLDDAGRPVPTLWEAVFGPLATWLIVFLSLFGLLFWSEGSLRLAPLVGIILISEMLFYVLALRTKRFVTREEPANKSLHPTAAPPGR